MTGTHKMGPTRLNHGAQQCVYCLATDREIGLALGPICPSAPTSALAVPEAVPAAEAPTFQARVQPWMMECFGPEISADKVERNDRFIEEALELVQSTGYTADRAHALVDYVFGRDIGEPAQEVGGVMVTLAALCLAQGLDMHDAGEVELARILQPEVVAKIRAKQAAKPTGSALPIAAPITTMTDGSPLTAGHREIDPATGMQKGYVVLSEEERAKGFVRPVRDSYIHETCGVRTIMSRGLAETYARDPAFYSGTFCAGCRDHFPVGPDGEFVWDGTSEKVGS